MYWLCNVINWNFRHKSGYVYINNMVIKRNVVSLVLPPITYHIDMDGDIDNDHIILFEWVDKFKYLISSVVNGKVNFIEIHASTMSIYIYPDTVYFYPRCYNEPIWGGFINRSEFNSKSIDVVYSNIKPL